MFADRVAQNASATSCDMILGKQFLFLFWVSAENSLHWANHWWAFSFHSALMPSATCHIAACHDSKCEETTPLVRNSDFADLCGLGSHGFLWSMPPHIGDGLWVHVDEHRSMCPDPDFRRGAMRVLAELPGVQVLATYADIPPLPKQKSSETCRRPIACLLPDVGTIMKECLSMGDIDMDNEAILLRVATLRVDTWTCLAEAPPCRLALSI